MSEIVSYAAQRSLGKLHALPFADFSPSSFSRSEQAPLYLLVYIEHFLNYVLHVVKSGDFTTNTMPAL